MIDASSLEQLTDAVAYHAEGPVWSDEWGGLRWVDMLAGDLLTLRTNGTVDRMATGSRIAAFVRPRASGGYLVGTERGLALSDSANDPPQPWIELWEDPGIRMNEGGCDPWGNLYCGSMAYARTVGAASLYRVTPSGDISVVEPSVTTSNGIDFAPDGALAYYNDTNVVRTDVYDASPGGLANRREFHSADDGRPDGLTVDSVGNVWVALNKVGRVRCYSPQGDVLDEFKLPVRLVTACTLGGDDGRDLYVTTSRENLTDPEPQAGAVFRLRVDVPGKPTLAFGG